MRASRFALIWLGLCTVGLASAQPLAVKVPPEAFAVCEGKALGEDCNFLMPRGEVRGTCRIMREGRPVCVPAGGPGGGMNRPPQGMVPDMQREGMRPGPDGGRTDPRVDIAGHDPSARKVASRIPDTHQGSCFDDNGVIPCPKPGAPFYGQDAQYEGATPSYRNNGDGTVTDRVTGLTWQQAHNARRLDWYAARQACAGLSLGGYADWRLPTIKELFSLADFRGSQGRRPYLDDIFEFHQPGAEVLQGDPFATHNTGMMGQTWSSTLYTGEHWGRAGVEAAFFFNFLDGHIKQAPTHGRSELFYRCVRGPVWGGNDFVDNRNGTVTDRASGLVWQQADDGRTRDWRTALAYCADLRLAGRADWRLPNVKELQSIVDYRRNDPAIDARYLRMSDKRGWFWSSTTHGDNVRFADYVCFGKCTSVDGVDVHGAGAQRSDPKSGDPSRYASGIGGQRDEVRIDNYVRCVRSAD